MENYTNTKLVQNELLIYVRGNDARFVLVFEQS